MKKFYPLLALAILLLSACSKPDTVLPDPYLKVTINGDVVQFDPQTFITENNADRTGYSAKNEIQGLIGGINFKSGTVVQVGTYKTTDNVSSIYFGFTKRDNYIVYNSDLRDGRPDPVYTIQIEEINQQFVKGRFFGNHLLNSRFGDMIQVPEGEFLFHR